MILSTSSNEPNNSHISPNVVGGLCGMLVCFIFLTATFIWGRHLFPFIQTLAGSLREKLTTFFSQNPPQFGIAPAVDIPSITPLARIVTYPLRRGPDSVDTLPPYTPSEGLSPSSTEHPTNPVV